MRTLHIWAAEVEGYLAAKRAGGAPTTTLYTRRQHLMHLAIRVEATPWELTADELVTYAAAQRWEPETRRGRRQTFLSFWRWANDAGKTTANPALRLDRVAPRPPSPRPIPERIFKEALVMAPERERLMLRLAGDMGMRRSEVAVVHPRNDVEEHSVWDDELGDWVSAWCLRVHGKGSKERTVPLTPLLTAALRSADDGYLFPGNDHGHLSPRWVGRLIADLLPDPWTMHSLRHRFATKAYAIDNDAFTVQQLLGHASPVTTRMYVRVPDASLRRTVLAVAA